MPKSYQVTPSPRNKPSEMNGTTNKAFENGSMENGINISKEPEVEIKDAKKKEEKEKQDMVGVFELFRFSEWQDRAYMAIGTFGALTLGTLFPLMLLWFGDMIDVFAKFGLVESLIVGINYTDPAIPFTEAEARADLTLLQPWLDATGLNQTIILSELAGSVLSQLERISLIFVAIAFGALVAGYLQITFWTMSAERQVWKIRKAFYSAVMRQDIGWFDTHEPGQINTRLSGDIATVKTGLSDKVGGFFQWGSMFLGGIIIGFIQGWKLALVIMAASPLLVIAATLMSKLVTSFTTMELGAYSKAGAVATEVLGSIKTVAAFGAEEKEAERYDSHLAEAKAYGIRRGVVVGLSLAFTFGIFFLSYALGFWYGAKLVAEDTTGAYTAGNVITVFFAIVMGSFSLGQAIPNYQALLRGRGAAHFIYRLIDRVPPIDCYSEEGEKPDQLTGHVRFNNVYFNYPSRKDVKVLQGLDLDVKNGQTVALVGASGCGKSTTVQLIQRFYDPDSGSVELDDRDIRDLNIGWLRQHIGVVSQEPVLFDTTIAENIRYGRNDVTLEEIQAACQEANVHEFIASLPDGYETLVGERGAQLSGGQKQRIAIARALVRDPKILLLDEATSALDTESERIVQQALDKVRQGRTTLIIAHRLSTVQTADRIVAIKDGRVAEDGTHSELMAKKGVYFTLVTTQTVDKENEIEGSLDDKSAIANISSLKRQMSEKEADKEEDGKEKDKKKKEEKKDNGGMGRLMKMNAPEALYILVGVLSAAVNGGLQPAYAIMFAEFISVFGETDPDIRAGRLLFVVLFFVGLAIAAFVTNFLQSVCFAKSGEALTERVRKLLFRAMLRQEMAYFDDPKNNTGALTTRLAQEAMEIQGAAGARLGLLTQSIAGLLTAIILSFVYGWQLALVIIGFVPFMIIGGAIEMKIMAGVANRDSAAVEDASKVAVEAVGNIRTVAQLTREKAFVEAYIDKLLPTHKKSLIQAHAMGIGYGLTQSMMYLIYAGAFYFGALFIDKGWMKFDAVFKVFSAMVFGAMGLGQASAFAPDYGKAESAAKNIFALLDRVSAIDSSSDEGETPESCQGTLEFKDVVFHYPTRPELTVLKELSAKASTGEVIALVGSSGCGKSTTVQLLERFYDVDGGEVLIDGHEVRKLNLKWLRSQMATVSQEPILFDLSLRKNIAYGLKDEPQMADIIEAAKKANIHDFIASLPLGYETRVGDKGTQLSGGQKQRIAIARALIRDPKILLLDEATSALDTESEKVVQEALDHAQEGRTCLVIAHRLSTIRNASTILVIQHGQVRESGTHAQLMQKQGIYYKLNSAQAIL